LLIAPGHGKATNPSGIGHVWPKEWQVRGERIGLPQAPPAKNAEGLVDWKHQRAKKTNKKNKGTEHTGIF